MSAEDQPTDEELQQIESEEEAAEYITLDFEDGGTERCEILGVFDYKDGEYIALAPESDDEGVYFYAYEEAEDGSFSLGDIESDETWEAVAKTYEDLVNLPE